MAFRFFLLLVLTFLPAAANAAAISGKVTTPQATLVNGARVTLFTADLRFFEERRTDPNGRFKVFELTTPPRRHLRLEVSRNLLDWQPGSTLFSYEGNLVIREELREEEKSFFRLRAYGLDGW